MQKPRLVNSRVPATSYELPATSAHVPVLLQEVITGLALRPGMTVVDCTVNAGGHAIEIARKIGKQGTLIGIDADPLAIERARQGLRSFPGHLHLCHGNFRNLTQFLAEVKVTTVDAILLDLGLSSDQLETSGRGFSFQKDEPLRMTFGEEGEFTAEEMVNTWDEANLADVIWGYGGERYAKRIARYLVHVRKDRPIRSTGELVEVIAHAMPSTARRGKIHFATKTFQALRIAVNDELGALRAVLPQAWSVLGPGGRLAVITFHSLEDRIVKQFMRERVREDGAVLQTKKPITPTPEEIKRNSRSRSAKLRIVEKDSS